VTKEKEKKAEMEGRDARKFRDEKWAEAGKGQ
jgi:hypothetical protein